MRACIRRIAASREKNGGETRRFSFALGPEAQYEGSGSTGAGSA
jgi:hypothetical protein